MCVRVCRGGVERLSFPIKKIIKNAKRYNPVKVCNACNGNRNDIFSMYLVFSIAHLHLLITTNSDKTMKNFKAVIEVIKLLRHENVIREMIISAGDFILHHLRANPAKAFH